MVAATRSGRAQNSEETRSSDGGVRDKTATGGNTGDGKSPAMPITTASPSSDFRKSSTETPAKIMSTSSLLSQALESHETHSRSTFPQDRSSKLEANGRSDSPVRRSQRIQKSVASSSPGLKNSNKSSSSLVSIKGNEVKNSSPSASDTELRDKSRNLVINDYLSKKGKSNARTYRAIFIPVQPTTATIQPLEKINTSGFKSEDRVNAADLSVTDMVVTMVSTDDKIDHVDPNALAMPNDTVASLATGVLIEYCPTSPSAPKVSDVDSFKDNDEFQRESSFLSSLDATNEKMPMEEDTVRPEESECMGISQKNLSPTLINNFVAGEKDDGANACVICRCPNAELDKWCQTSSTKLAGCFCGSCSCSNVAAYSVC